MVETILEDDGSHSSVAISTGSYTPGGVKPLGGLFSLRASRRGHAVAVAHVFLRLVYMLSIWLSVYAVWEDDATQLFRI